MRNFSYKLKRLAGLLFFTMVLLLFSSISAFAESGSHKTVKIGYYEDHNFQIGAEENLVKSGYSFEYLQRLQMYADWDYEYVYGDFGEMYDALINGDVDILTGLAFKEERTELFDYATLPMGNSVYSLVKKQGRDDITSDISSFSSKRIGALEGTMYEIVKKMLLENGITAELVSFNELYDRDNALMDGTVDIVILESSATAAVKEIQVITEIGANDYYVCVSKKRPDILEDLNRAQEEMFSAYPQLKEDLYNKWFRSNAQNASLSENEEAWVEAHSELKVGYYTTYLPYSGIDEDGNVTGIVKDVVPELLKSLNITEVNPVYRGYDSYDEMIEALKSGEIDILFPAFTEYWSAEKLDIMPTDGVISTYYNIVYKDEYPTMENMKLAFRKSNLLVQSYSMYRFHCCEVTLYDTVQDCLDAVLAGKADATLINGLRTPSYMLYDKTYSSLHLSQVPGSVPLGFGARRNDSTTVEIFNHAISIMDPDYALEQTHNYEQKNELSVGEFIAQNWWIVAAPLMIVVLVVLLFVAIELKRNRKTLKQEEEHNRELLEKLRVISELKQKADAASKAKTDFLFSMSHDIRTPMNAAIGYTELLEKNLDDREKTNDYLQKIKDANSMLLSIINNVLEMSRIESGSITLDEVVYSTEQFEDTICSIFKAMMAKKDITFTRSIDVEHEYVYCDPIKLREIIVNIIGNAQKYTQPGGSVHMELRELPSDRDGWTLFQTTISDTGIGIDESFLPYVFDAFSREGNTTETKIEGTGLGLSIVKRLVDFMDGTIEVKSKKGVGTTFIVTIPLRIASKEELVQADKEAHFEGSFSGKRILLAEDNDLNAEIAVEILKEAGFEVLRVENGRACVEELNRAADGYYDVILMDIQMPVMNGYDAAREIRSLENRAKAGIPIIAMTANAFEEDKKNAFDAGMNGHVAKPIDITKLMSVLAKVLNTRK
ncbi:MAG: transporter substrate-binding domain-containing protein [Eubacteriales bacterium]|nr:transporter substrate-binding domain-containing protein [Eubacteriales bacterium]